MPLKTIIYTVRHGHTSYNAEKRYAGTIDIPLSEKGIKDCQAVSHKLTGYSFDVVVTSTMKRSIETARLLAPNNSVITQSALCNERKFGVMEGRTWDEVVKFDPPILMINVGNELHTVNPQGGEPFEEVWRRAIKFRDLIFKEHKGKNILVVSHGVFLQMFHGLLKGLNCIESLAFLPSNLELTSFDFSGDRLIETRAIMLNQADGENF